MEFLTAAKPDWISGKRVNVIVQLATRKHRDLGDVPLVMEFAKTHRTRASWN